MPDDDPAVEAAFRALLLTLTEDREHVSHHAEWGVTSMDGDFHLLSALRAAITAYERAKSKSPIEQARDEIARGAESGKPRFRLSE